MHPAVKAAYVRELAEASRRGARNTECPRCGAPCYSGDDHDDVAATATVDVEPLDRLGEAFAILAGRATFDLAPAKGKTGRPGQMNLYIREPWHVDSPRTWGTVHAAHRCNPKATQ